MRYALKAGSNELFVFRKVLSLLYFFLNFFLLVGEIERSLNDTFVSIGSVILNFIFISK